MNYCLKTDQYKYQIILNFSNGSETTAEKSPDFIFKTSSPALKNTPFVRVVKMNTMLMTGLASETRTKCA